MLPLVQQCAVKQRWSNLCKCSNFSNYTIVVRTTLPCKGSVNPENHPLCSCSMSGLVERYNDLSAVQNNSQQIKFSAICSDRNLQGIYGLGYLLGSLITILFIRGCGFVCYIWNANSAKMLLCSTVMSTCHDERSLDRTLERSRERSRERSHERSFERFRTIS